MVRVAINGFGRIGRITLRVALSRYRDQVEVVAINTSGSMEIEGWAHLFKYDSVYGQFASRVVGKRAGEQESKKGEIGRLLVGNQEIPVLAERDPARIPWKKYQAEVVIESTGVFRDKKSASAHLEAGAQKVVISAPAKETPTIVMGVNEQDYRGQLVVNNASCTTNCVAPVTQIVLDNFGIQKAFLTTIHAYTADQELVDGSHQDLRRARAAAVNIVPTSTGAAMATTQVLPSLKGLFDGLAFRVPVVCGSVSDFTFLTVKRTTAEAVNRAFKKAAVGRYRGLVEVSEEPLVSSDIIGRTTSTVVDLSLTKVIDQDLVKVIAWYDNEWGYACRLTEEAVMVGSK